MTTPETDAALRATIDAALAATSAPTSWDWKRVAADSRHEIWQISAGNYSLIVKVYRPKADRYYQHRWRREERSLDLLERAAPGLAPRLHAAVLAPGAFAAVAMENLGIESLATRLERVSSSERSQWLQRAVSVLADFRQAAARQQGILRALAFQSDLDRITRNTVERRLAIAIVRLRDPTQTIEPDASPRRLGLGLPWQDLDTGIVTPLIQSPRRIVHNGFSPLNLIARPDARLSVIDWETLAVAAPSVDTADLLTFPGFRLEPEAVDEHARGTALNGRGTDEGHNFWAAAAERSLTYAATAAVREKRASKFATPDYPARRRWYLRMFGNALERLSLDSAARRRIRDAVSGLDR